MTRIWHWAALAIAVTVPATTGSAEAATAGPNRVSGGRTAQVAEGSRPAISDDGRWIAYEGSDDALPVYETGPGIYLKDLWTGHTSMIMRRPDGSAPYRRWAYRPVISGDGRYIAYTSGAADLVRGDTNDADDLFLFDRVTGHTTRIDVASDGTQARFNGYGQPDARPAISRDGRFVLYTSGATNLVPGDTNDTPDVFLYDRWSRHTSRVSHGGHQNADPEASAITGDGRYLGYLDGDSGGSVTDRWTGRVTRSRYWIGTGPMSGNARFVVYCVADLDRNVFVTDSWTGTTTQLTVSARGAPANSYTEDVPQISADGRYVTYSSHASNLAPGDTNDTDDVFLHDRWTHRTIRVPTPLFDSSGMTTDVDSRAPRITPDGRYIAYDVQGAVWVYARF